MKKTICIAAIICAVVILLACGNTIDEGDVYDKEFNKEKNIVLDFGPMGDYIAVVAEYVGAPAEKIEANCPLDMIMDAYRTIDSNIAEAFVGEQAAKNAEGRQRPKK
ncbi:MAG: hypothetical protein ACOYJB_00680 [Christensenellaceae bacterium]